MFYNSLIQKGIEAAGKDWALNKPVGADKGPVLYALLINHGSESKVRLPPFA